jgi:threonine/homoserine/homoserine lactone efflux protein
MSPEFLLTTFIIVASPGTGALYTISTGLTRGGRASLVAALGCTLGIVPHLVAAMCGVAVILHSSALAFSMLKYLGVAYLLYMAWHSLREAGALKVEDARERSACSVIVHAVLINILNPKLSLFFLAFLPQFVDSGQSGAVGDMLVLSGIFMAMTFAVFTLYGLFAAGMRDQVISRPAVMAWIRRSFAAAFVALGVKLALTER